MLHCVAIFLLVDKPEPKLQTNMLTADKTSTHLLHNFYYYTFEFLYVKTENVFDLTQTVASQL